MNTKRLQIVLTEEAWTAVDTLTREANKDFDGGSINFSDAINEMILTAKVDLKALQLKHTDLRKWLVALAKKPDVDADTILKCVTELKGRGPRKKAQTAQEEMT